MSEAQHLVWCDGDCSNNNTQQAQGYASYRLKTRMGQKQVVCLTDLPGVSTNNEVEYVALVSALVDLRGRIDRAGKSPYDFSVAVHTDSQLMVGQLTEGWKVRGVNPSISLRRSLVGVPRE